jgi:hypothetical protein
VSEGIKRMLAEREALAERERVSSALEDSPKKLLESEAAMKMVDLAQPFIDGISPDPTKWLPSSLLRIGYCVISTGDNPETALDFVERHLDIARERYKAGLDPNPFLGRP